jgi:undecaprenyl-diphosphatase
MQAGALGAPLAIGAFAFIRGDRQRGVRIAVTGLMAWGAAKALKREVGRGRPSEVVEDTQIRLGSADRGLGFPSGHAAVAMTLIASIPRDSHPIVRIGGGALALGVGLSRIYVGAHLPLDVVGGWALGLSIASAYDEVFRTNG